MAHELAQLGGFQLRAPTDAPLIVGRWPGWHLVLFAQAEITPYRVDFLVCSDFGADVEQTNALGHPPWGMVIECDGHEFHERTKAQARRDRQRDRIMTMAGITVFRFTGSEIYRSGESCALEALEMAAKIQNSRLNEHFTQWLLAQPRAAE